MDISKLPRMSKTTTPPNEAGPDVPVPPEAGFSVFQSSVPAAIASPPPTAGLWCTQCHAPNAPGSYYCNGCGAPLRPGDLTRRAADPGPGAEAWVSIAVGVILLFLSPNLIKYLMSPSTFEQNVSITDETGAPLAYTRSVFFWGDLSLTLFALVLIVEGIVIVFGRRPMLVLFALALTVTTTVMNLLYVGGMMAKGYGLQIMSALAVAFGVYIAIFQWRLWNVLRQRTA